MAEHDATRGPDDVPDKRAMRFGLRGKQDIVDCFVSWEALDSLEDAPAATRAERFERFERHRPAIEAAAVAKHGHTGNDRPLHIGADEVLSAAKS